MKRKSRRPGLGDAGSECRLAGDTRGLTKIRCESQLEAPPIIARHWLRVEDMAA